MDRDPTQRSLISFQYHSLPDEVGGSSALTHQINKRLAARGWDVHLIVCKPTEGLPDYEVVEGVHFHRIRHRDSRNLFRLWRAITRRINQIFRQTSVSLVHIHNPLVGYLALLNPLLKTVPIVTHFHGSWLNTEKTKRQAQRPTSGWAGIIFPLKLTCILRAIKFMEIRCFQSSRSILFLSEFSRSHFLKVYRKKKARLRVIPGGVDVNAFFPLQPDQDLSELRRELGLPADRPILLTVQRLEAGKGLENLIHALGQIDQRCPNLDFLLVISGKGSLGKSLNDLIQQNDLQSKVQLTGMIPREILPSFYRAADVFVLPTLSHEGPGLVMFEALATGLPVLGTPIGGTVEILNDVDESLLFPGTTEEAISLRIEKYLKNPKPFEALKSRCQERAVSHYSWDKVVDLIDEEFALVLGK